MQIVVNHQLKGEFDTGIKKGCKVKAFCGCLCILFARNPEILSGIQVGYANGMVDYPEG